MLHPVSPFSTKTRLNKVRPSVILHKVRPSVILNINLRYSICNLDFWKFTHFCVLGLKYKLTDGESKESSDVHFSGSVSGRNVSRLLWRRYVYLCTKNKSLTFLSQHFFPEFYFLDLRATLNKLSSS